jgi:hypothetical protein
MSDSVIKKIMHCEALSKSGNANEAANALRQMHALMKKHQISITDVLAADVTEQTVEGTTKADPDDWVLYLHSVVAKAFECEGLYASYRGHYKCDLKFIGVAPAPEIAAYTFEVLLRQLKSARRKFIAEKLSKRLGAKNKKTMADAFCLGWTAQVSTKCADINPNAETKAKIKAYMNKKHEDIKEKQGSSKQLSGSVATARDAALRQGYQAASDVSLYSPVAADAPNHSLEYSGAAND